MQYKPPAQGWGKLLMGLVLGSALTFGIGFTLGGWQLNSTVKYAQEEAVVNAFMPLCVEKFKAQPDAEEKLQKLQKSYSSLEQEAIVAKSGSATLPGQDVPNKKLAEACTQQLKNLPRS